MQWLGFRQWIELLWERGEKRFGCRDKENGGVKIKYKLIYNGYFIKPLQN
jgi:hypothetical protein